MKEESSKTIGCVGGVEDNECPVVEEAGILVVGESGDPVVERGRNPKGGYGQVAARVLCM